MQLIILLVQCTYAQTTNTISNDGTTNPFWYVGYDSTARIGIGIDQGYSLSNNLTLNDKASAGSQSFAAGWQAGSGWKLEADQANGYSLTVDNLNLRGSLTATELLLDQVKATNGNLFITSGAKVDSAGSSGSVIKMEDVTGHGLSPFVTGDIIMCQAVNSAGLSFDPSGDAENNQYLIKRLIYKVDSARGLNVFYSGLAGSPAGKNMIKKGDTFVRIGNANLSANPNRGGTIGLFTDEQYSPFLRVTDNVQSWEDWKSLSAIKVQLGRLDGISDPDFGGNLEGYGLYSNNAYIKGKIIVTNPEDFNISTLWNDVANKPALFNAPSGAGLFITATNLGFYNTINYPSDPWRTYMDNQGRFYLNGSSGNNYLSWNGSTLNISGHIELTNLIPYTNVNGLGALATGNNLDDVANGSTYARLLKTDIQAGHVVLSSVLGTIDDISNGNLYGKILLTDIQAGHIKLSESIGNLDDIENGLTYGKVLSTDISAGHIKITGSDNLTTVIDGGKIQTGSIKASDISAGAITATKLNVTTLSAISANLGDVTAGNISGVTITGGSLQTSSSGQRVVISGSSNKIEYYKSGGTLVGSIYGGNQAGIGDAIIISGKAGFSSDIALSGSTSITGNIFPAVSLSPVTYGSISGWLSTGYFDAIGYKVNGNAINYSNISGSIPTHNQNWSTITSTPTTISGYGISDALSNVGSYSNPSWLTTLDITKLKYSGSSNVTATFNGMYEASSGNRYSLNFTNGILTYYSNYGSSNTFTGSFIVSSNGLAFDRQVTVNKGVVTTVNQWP